VPLPIEQAWTFLQDVPAIALCIPGVEITDIIDDRNFRGLGRVRLGPVELALQGTAALELIDPGGRIIIVQGQGQDKKGRGGTRATVTVALTSVQSQATQVELVTDVELSGAIAQYGRASGMIDAVAQQIVAQFAKNLREVISRSSADPGASRDHAGEPRIGDVHSDNSLSIVGMLWRMIASGFGRSK
jgi:carbon monoxide dehydrogenase subunit G